MTKQESILKAIADSRNALTPIGILLEAIGEEADAQPPYVDPVVTLDREALTDARECYTRLRELLDVAYIATHQLP